MLFSSIPFLYYFLPIVLGIYFLVPKKTKNSVLLVSSLFFYGYGEPKYIFVMLINIMVNYLLTLLIDKTKEKPKLSKTIFVLDLSFNIGMIGYFKYANFFIENFVKITGFSVQFLNIALPIGISFYTFQILSYVIDVYLGKVKVQKNPFTLGTYIVLFPQLIAGPIVRYSDIEKQLVNRTHNFDKFADGIRRFIYGLSKKILLANVLGELCITFQTTNEKSVLFYWLFAIAYTFQIYFDFSGYSDMAIGLGKMFGFDFCENFNYPFISKSISEFWRRWHISLGTWFKEYVYIPMGGSKCKKSRLLLNILTVWLLTGFWHGAEWNFIIWGLYFSLFLLLEKYFLYKHLNKFKILNHVYVLFFVLISFVIFNLTDFNSLGVYLSSMFGFSNIPFKNNFFLYQLNNYKGVLILSILCSTPIFSKLKNKYLSGRIIENIYDIFEILFLVLLLLTCTAYLVDGSFNPFLYFRF